MVHKCFEMPPLLNALGFLQDIAPNNLHSCCQRFIEEESKNHGVLEIVFLMHSTSDDATDYGLLINKLAEDSYNILINRLAKHALAFQNSDDKKTFEISELLLELRKLHPRIVDATLQEFGRLEVNMVDFFSFTHGALCNTPFCRKFHFNPFLVHLKSVYCLEVWHFKSTF